MAVLSSHPDLWSLYGESHTVFEGPFRPNMEPGSSHLLRGSDAKPEILDQMERQFYSLAGNIDQIPLFRRVPLRGRGRRQTRALIRYLSLPSKRPGIRLVEKTIPNAFRIPFLKTWFPEAKFIHLTADPRRNLVAMYRGWTNPNPRIENRLPDWFHIKNFDGRYWRFVLPPGWETQSGKRLMAICAYQWRSVHEECLQSLEELPQADWRRVRFEDLVSAPAEVLFSLASWAGVDPQPLRRFFSGMPRINTSRRKGRPSTVFEDDLNSALESVSRCSKRLGYLSE
jgi:Sulfotransferase family